MKSRGMKGRITGGLAVVSLSVAFVGCGTEDPAGPDEESDFDFEVELVVDSALAGTWLGTIEGTNTEGQTARSGVRFELHLSGSLAVEPFSPPLRPIPAGAWGVVDNDFVAIGKDTAGNQFLFRAPRSEARLQGTWEYAFGSGTFNITPDAAEPTNQVSDRSTSHMLSPDCRRRRGSSRVSARQPGCRPRVIRRRRPS